MSLQDYIRQQFPAQENQDSLINYLTNSPIYRDANTPQTLDAKLAQVERKIQAANVLANSVGKSETDVTAKERLVQALDSNDDNQIAEALYETSKVPSTGGWPLKTGFVVDSNSLKSARESASNVVDEELWTNKATKPALSASLQNYYGLARGESLPNNKSRILRLEYFGKDSNPLILKPTNIPSVMFASQALRESQSNKAKDLLNVLTATPAYAGVINSDELRKSQGEVPAPIEQEQQVEQTEQSEAEVQLEASEPVEEPEQLEEPEPLEAPPALEQNVVESVSSVQGAGNAPEICSSAETQLRALGEQISNHKQQISTFREAANDAAEKLAQQQAVIESLRRDNDANSELSQLQQQLKEQLAQCEGDKARLEEERDNCNQEKIALEERLNGFDRNSEVLRAQIAALADTIRGEDAQLGSIASLEEQVKAQLATLQTEQDVQKAKDLQVALENRAQAIVAQMQAQKVELDEAKAQLAAAEKQIADLEARIAELETQLANFDANIKKNEEQGGALRIQLDQCGADRDAQLKLFENHCRNQSEQLNNYQADMNEISSEISNIVSQLRQAIENVPVAAPVAATPVSAAEQQESPVALPLN